MKKIYFLVAVMFLFMFGYGQAETNISDCGSILATDTYLLNQSVVVPAYTDCFSIVSQDVILDCQGNTIDGDFLANDAAYVWDWSGGGFVAKNCIFTNFAGIFSYERIEGAKLINDTFENSLYVTSSYEIGGNVQIENNTFKNISGAGIIFNAGYTTGNFNITHNTFNSDVVDGLYFVTTYAGTGNRIFNNNFGMNTTIYIADSGVVVAEWNTTPAIGDSVLFGNNKPIGGNYWGACTDSNCDGYCDNNLTLINDVNNDSKPLSTCYITPIPSQYQTNHAVTINRAALVPAQYEFYFQGQDQGGANYTSATYNFTLAFFDNQGNQSMLPTAISRIVDTGFVPSYEYGIYLFGMIILLLVTGLAFVYGGGTNTAIPVFIAMLITEGLIGFLPIYVIVPFIFIAVMFIVRFMMKGFGREGNE